MSIFDRRLAAASVIALCAAAAPSALATPTQVTLHLDGSHPVGVDYHQGTFTASPPLCPSGSWIGNGSGSRVFTCANGSGSFEAGFQGELEHTQGARGPWTIYHGTGSFAALRGAGTATIDFSTGESVSPITFRDTWTGIVDFDVVPPTGSFTAITVRHEHGHHRRFRVTVSFSARDNVEANPVRFEASAIAGPYLAVKTGTTTDGKGSFTLAFRRARRTRSLRVEIELSDPWGNVSRLKKKIRLRASAGAATRARALQAAGSAQSSLEPPRLVVRHRGSGDAPGYIFIAPQGGQTAHGPEIVDGQGRPVWFHPGPEASDFRVQSYLGKPVLTWYQGGIDYIVDSSYQVVATVHAGNGLDLDGHEFALTPQGTALVTIFHGVPFDLSSVGGPKDGVVVDGIVQEIDVATGRVLFEWHSLDQVQLAESYLPVPQDDVYDYFHINAVNLDNDGNLLISGRHTWTIYKVDRHTGQILWRLGGKRSDFTMGPGVQFAWQHNPLPAGASTIRLFDNENNGEPGGRVMAQSRVIWIHLDTATMKATLVKAIAHPAALSVPAQGNAQALENGDTFVGWGQLGRVSEFDPQGKLLFDATLPGGSGTYRGYRFPWAGQPDTLPTATARHTGRRRTTVHALWNGATQVAAWRILAGRRASRLIAVRTAPWNGLDTALKIRGKPRSVEVVALDARGDVIGKSQPVRVRLRTRRLHRARTSPVRSGSSSPPEMNSTSGSRSSSPSPPAST